MLTQSALDGFYGTESYTDVTRVLPMRQPKKFYATDGVKFVMENGGTSGAYWLIQAILSHQPTVLKNERCQEMQFWTLTVNQDKSAILTCVEDSDLPPVVKQEIEYTDFDLPELKIWIELGSLDGVNEAFIMMLPSER